MVQTNDIFEYYDVHYNYKKSNDYVTVSHWLKTYYTGFYTIV